VRPCGRPPPALWNRLYVIADICSLPPFARAVMAANPIPAAASAIANETRPYLGLMTRLPKRLYSCHPDSSRVIANMQHPMR
jgi:hypothetical protein